MNHKNCIDQIYKVNENEIDSLSIAFEFIEENIKQNNFTEIDKLFQYIDLNKTNKILIIGLFRATFRIKHKLNNWQHKLEEVNSMINDKHRLRGLI